jgi:hypothetical protein
VAAFSGFSLTSVNIGGQKVRVGAGRRCWAGAAIDLPGFALAMPLPDTRPFCRFPENGAIGGAGTG